MLRFFERRDGCTERENKEGSRGELVREGLLCERPLGAAPNIEIGEHLLPEVILRWHAGNGRWTSDGGCAAARMLTIASS